MKSSVIISSFLILSAIIWTRFVSGTEKIDLKLPNTHFKFDIKRNLIDKLFNWGKLPNGESIGPLDFLLEDFLPPFYGQRANNENGTRSEYKEYNMNDDTNEDAVFLSGQDLITRSGFKYETFDAVADDGYITTLTRLINPLADKSQLKQPPILMEHGGTIDPTAYIIASSIQHFPEVWPRKPEDGPMRSWNRSLAFVLANNGYDVWLGETRGSNDANSRRSTSRAIGAVFNGENARKNMTIAENIRLLLESWDYWSFSQDDIVAHEYKSHIDTVLKITGSQKLHLFTFSLSTPTSLAFLGSRPDYAAKVQGYVSMAPIVSGQGVSLFVRLVFETFCPFFPNELGTLFFTDLLLTKPFRDLLLFWSRPPQLRYMLTKTLITLGMGPSAKYQTLLDMNVLGHLMRRLSFKELKQMCQQMRSNKLQKFDYGPIKNQILYNQTSPPEYDLSNLNIRDWIIVAARHDSLSTPQVVDHLIDIVNPKPIARLEVPHFNHADLFAGWENDKYVNLPILRYYDQMSYDPTRNVERESRGSNDRYNLGSGTGSQGGQSRGRSLDLTSLLPSELQPIKLLATGINVTKSAGSMVQPQVVIPIDARGIIEELGKNMRQLMSGVSEGISSFLTNGNSKKNTKNDDYFSEADQRQEEGQSKTSSDKAKATTTSRSASGTSGTTASPKPTLPFVDGLPNLIPGAEQISSNLGNFMNSNNMMQNFGNLGRMLRLPNLDAKPSSRNAKQA